MKTIIMGLVVLVILGLWLLCWEVQSDHPIEISHRVMTITLERGDRLLVSDWGNHIISRVSVTREINAKNDYQFNEKLGSGVQKIVIYRYNY